MQCLYCGKQLALLRRLTGGGEFCSEAHKQSYQEEYNRLALSRLLQAQSKPGEIKTRASTPAPAEGLGKPLPPGASRHRALPASSPDPGTQFTRPYAEPVPPPPVQSEQAAEEVVTAVPEVEEAPPNVVVETPPTEVVEAATPGMAGFQWAFPPLVWVPDETPYVEPFLDITAAPISPRWQAVVESFALGMAPLAALDIGLPGEVEYPAVTTELIARDFGRVAVNLDSLSDQFLATVDTAGPAIADGSGHTLSNLPTAELVSLALGAPVMVNPPLSVDVLAAPVDFTNPKVSLNAPDVLAAPPSRAFPAASPIPLAVRVAISKATHPASPNGTLNFPFGVSFQESSLLTLYPASIDFPHEDSEVVLVAPWADTMFGESAQAGSEDQIAVALLEPVSTPRQTLAALSLLHQDLAEEQEARQAPAESFTAAVETIETPAALPAAVETPAGEPLAKTIEVSAQPLNEPPIPRPMQDLFDIPLKTLPPAKPSIVAETDPLLSLAPAVPQLKSLPLRPKVAKAPPGFSPQPNVAPDKTPAVETKSKETASVPQARPEIRTKQESAPAAKQATPPVKSGAPAQAAKSGQTAKSTQPVKPVQPAKPQQAAKPLPAQTKPASPPQAKPTASAPSEQPKRPAAAQSEQRAQGAAPETKAPGAPPEKKVSEAAPGATADEGMPSFATIQPVKSVPFLASLQLKLIIAMVLLVIAGGIYFARSGKTRQAVSSSHAAEDVVGPSIMMGEGGWVQNWGGDVNGSHAGRQITIYRPSLKLSDYRIEFQGEIDSKSMGWVFRALDPYNYYATKLAFVSPGPSPRVALIKYSVEQGHETEVGRVPLDITATSDTLFNVRMDVRGSTFRTYVQGQPVDVWKDERLKSGGVGLLNERAERARIKTISIYYLAGGKN